MDCEQACNQKYSYITYITYTREMKQTASNAISEMHWRTKHHASLWISISQTRTIQYAFKIATLQRLCYSLCLSLARSLFSSLVSPVLCPTPISFFRAILFCNNRRCRQLEWCSFDGTTGWISVLEKKHSGGINNLSQSAKFPYKFHEKHILLHYTILK